MVDKLRRLKFSRSSERFQTEDADSFALLADLIASNILYTPSGSLSGTDLQTALDELVTTVDGFSGGSITIGDAIGSAVNNAILHIDGSGNLAATSDLIYASNLITLINTLKIAFDSTHYMTISVDNGGIATLVAENNGLEGSFVFSNIVSVPDDAYDATNWNGSLEVPTKNAIRDKIESLSGSGLTQPEVLARSFCKC